MKRPGQKRRACPAGPEDFSLAKNTGPTFWRGCDVWPLFLVSHNASIVFATLWRELESWLKSGADIVADAGNSPARIAGGAGRLAARIVVVPAMPVGVIIARPAAPVAAPAASAAVTAAGQAGQIAALAAGPARFGPAKGKPGLVRPRPGRKGTFTADPALPALRSAAATCGRSCPQGA